jgi:tRNA(Ile)-lysidine synthase TilS/MesJ
MGNEKKFKTNQKDKIDSMIRQTKGTGRYDGLCCYSGGKDSTFMLKTLKKPLIITDLGEAMNSIW